MSSEWWVVSDGGSERWGVGRDVACSVRREHKSYNLTHLAKFYSKPLAGLAWFAWVKTSDAARRRPYILATHYSLLIAHYSLLKMFFCRKMNLRLIPHICQKTRKGNFGVRKENVKDFNLLIIKWIQTNEIIPENTRKKDLSVSGVLLKSFWKNT